MAVIKSGASTDQLTVHPTAKGARVLLYGPDAEPLVYNSGATRGIADIRIQQSATTAAPAIVWALRNSGSSVIYINQIIFHLFQRGTGAATEMQYEFLKYTGCTAFGGSPTAVTPIAKRTSLGVGTGVTIAVLDTGMTLTSATIGAAFYSAFWERVTHSATPGAESIGPQHILPYHSIPIELAANETLVIRTVQTAVVGDGMNGSVEFFG